MVPIAFFRANLAYARNLVAIARAVDSQTTAVVDITDILRAALVAGVSSLDHYVHEKVRTMMLGIYASANPGTDAYGRFTVALSSVETAFLNPGSSDWLDGEIRRQHALLSFQKPDKIADAVRMISPVKLWEEVGTAMTMPPADVKRELTLIVDRRNQIAHEADVDPTPPHDRWPIAYADVDRALGFIEHVGTSIETVC
jgi:hypothetical protein